MFPFRLGSFGDGPSLSAGWSGYTRSSSRGGRALRINAMNLSDPSEQWLDDLDPPAWAMAVVEYDDLDDDDEPPPAWYRPQPEAERHLVEAIFDRAPGTTGAPADDE